MRDAEQTDIISISNEFKKNSILKFELLANGAKITKEANDHLLNFKKPIRTRSGASGGLDIILPGKIHVNVPIKENFVTTSHLRIDYLDNNFVIEREDGILSQVELQATPHYYNLNTVDGIPMVNIGQMCSGDRFCYGMTGPYCRFWKKEDRCRFCSIGLNKADDFSQKKIDQLIEVLRLAVDDPNLPAKHILVGGGTPDGDDMGAILASKVCLEIKKRINISCYVMISAPLKDEYIKLLHDSGADELGMNIEFYSDEAWAKYIPGKKKYIGKKRYFEALDYSVKVFGPINTRSILVVGLENPDFSIEGAVKLASLGIMPILSPFRPLTGTYLENSIGFDYLTNWNIFNEINSRISTYNIPVGPTCIPCQNNVLALPLPNGHFHSY